MNPKPLLCLVLALPGLCWSIPDDPRPTWVQLFPDLLTNEGTAEALAALDERLDQVWLDPNGSPKQLERLIWAIGALDEHTGAKTIEIYLERALKMTQTDSGGQPAPDCLTWLVHEVPPRRLINIYHNRLEALRRNAKCRCR